MTKMLKEYKPEKIAYVWFSIAKLTIFTLIVLIVGVIVLLNVYPIALSFFIAVIAILYTYLFLSITISFSKERYEFYEDRIIRYGGGIFSQFQSELTIKNITHLEQVKPFIEFKLFETSHIRIESAGSSLSQVFLQNITKGDIIYEEIQNILQKNGFSLKRKKILAQEQPKTIAILIQLFQEIFGFLFVIIILLITSGTIILSFLDYISNNIFLLTFVGITFILGLLFLFFRLIIRFLDLQMRTYIVYDDAVTYAEGFLTKKFDIIPVENIADASVEQTIFDRIIQTYTIIVSCQGSQNNIVFSNVPNGDFIQKHIANLAKNQKPKMIKNTQTVKTSKVVKTQKQTNKNQKSKQTLFQTKMHTARALFSLLFLIPLLLIPPIWPFLLIGFITKLIAIYKTTYIITENSTIENFSFLRKKHVEFQDKRITGVIYSEDIIDKFFGTCSIEFWSIGSGQTIKFSHIKMQKKLIDYIKEVHKFTEKKVQKKVKPTFTIIAFLSRYIPILILIPIITIIITIFNQTTIPFELLFAACAFAIFLFVGIWQFIKTKITNIQLYKTYIEIQRGILIKKKFFIAYENVKGRTDITYPFIQNGTTQIDVAGERQVTQQNGQKSGISNSVRIPYIDNCFEQTLFDKNDKTIYTIKPKFANALFLCFIFIITIPLIPVVLWYLNVKSYEIRTKRIMQFSGLFYKKRTQIYYTMFDHIDTEQGVLNKIFQNGKILVYTTGSSSVNMIVQNIKNFKKTAQDLSKVYK